MSRASFELTDVSLSVGDRTIVGPVSLRVPAGETLALLGPAGTGKSTLLRVLAGEIAPELARTGRWSYQGRAALPSPSAVVRVPQPVRGEGPAPSWEAAFAQGASAVLLDEPVSSAPADRERLGRAIEAHRAGGGTTVVVTHDLSLARRVADRVALLVAGRIVEEGPAEAFFASPRSSLAERFLAQGNCWPAPEPPALPDHFQWIVPDRLAGSGLPGLLAEVDDDLTAIATAGVQLLVSLTRAPFDPGRLRAFGIRGRHFPIKDMGVPALGATAQLCADITRTMEANRAVAVHCRAGLGRTGTILASVLVWQGADPDEAVARIRERRSGYIQNRAQLSFVHRFADYAR
jgi:atypical dual specificity phosphatase